MYSILKLLGAYYIECAIIDGCIPHYLSIFIKGLALNKYMEFSLSL